MRIRHPTSNIERPTPNGVRDAGSLDVGRSMLNVECSPLQRGSVLIIVLWVAIGLVSIALYFANSMSYELRASDNRVNGLASGQAIEGAARYVAYVLEMYSTNGAVPDPSQYSAANVPIGDAHFWLIGRDPSGTPSSEPYFGLVDEASRLNLNTVNTNVLSYLPNMTVDFANAIMDWRGTNGSVSLDYATLGYVAKNAPFETVDELRLVYGATPELLAGDDVNRNGVLDANEKDLIGNGQVESGLLEYTTVYTREPNFHSDGTMLTNINTLPAREIYTFLQDEGVGNATAMATSISNYLHPAGATARTFNGMVDFAVRCRNFGMASADFSKMVDDVTTSSNTYIRGRINVNTASADVLTALFMGLNVDEASASGAAQTLVTYRTQNPNNLQSVAWIIDALGVNNPVVVALQGGDYLTTHSFQFTADIVAVGSYGRGYQRVKFIFDTSEGTPIILYRQDLSRLGWALGDKARQTLLVNNTTQ